MLRAAQIGNPGLEEIAVSESMLAALKVAASTMEFRDMEIPEIPADAALLKVEVAGVCGTDVSQYRLPLRASPIIMGGIHVRRDNLVSVMYSPGLNSLMSLVTRQRTDRHGILD